MLVNNQWIKKYIKEFMETNENRNTIVQIMWDAAKVVLKGKFIAIQAYFKKHEWFQKI